MINTHRVRMAHTKTVWRDDVNNIMETQRWKWILTHGFVFRVPRARVRNIRLCLRLYMHMRLCIKISKRIQSDYCNTSFLVIFIKLQDFLLVNWTFQKIRFVWAVSHVFQSAIWIEQVHFYNSVYVSWVWLLYTDRGKSFHSKLNN